jgi:hypothetical protein
VPDGQLDQVAGDILARLSASSRSALALTKRLFMELEGKSFGDGIALGARVNALARTTPDFRAALARFLAK